MASEKYGSPWTRDELVLALYLYCQIPFAKTKANNPEVIRLARVIGRTPASVARKLGNFGAFDPLLASQGIKGLSHGSRVDRVVWDEFYQQWDNLVAEANSLLAQLASKSSVPSADMQARDEDRIIVLPTGPTETKVQTTVRLCQSFFRRTILSSYESRCCICSLEFPALLTASHILPWSRNEHLRADPENGLCLCALHDRAFDRGLITVAPSLEIVVSKRLVESKVPFSKAAFAVFHGEKIRKPRRFAPRAEALRWHNENAFMP
jgi:putative restriction endonuclease